VYIFRKSSPNVGLFFSMCQYTFYKSNICISEGRLGIEFVSTKNLRRLEGLNVLYFHGFLDKYFHRSIQLLCTTDISIKEPING